MESEEMGIINERIINLRTLTENLHSRVHVAEDKIIKLEVNDDIVLPMVRTHEQILRLGDGSEPSLVDDVRTIKRYIAGTTFWLRSIALIFVTQFIAFVFAGIVFFIRVLPVLQKISNMP